MVKKLIFGLLLIGGKVFSQSDYLEPTKINPTPNVSNLNGFIDYPVNLSTGGVNISIPVYTIQIGEINVPISLDYNVNNISVNGTSSNIGLGWSLNAGGVVSRNTLGVPDEVGYGFMNTSDKLHLIYNGTKTESELSLLEAAMMRNDLDFQADIFHYSSPSFQGKFAYNQVENKFNQIPLSDNKISYTINSSKISEWLITNNLGIKYYYGLDDVSKEAMVMNSHSGNSIPPNSNIPQHFNCWYLSKIEDTKGNIVIFEYDYVIKPGEGSIFIKNVSKGIDVKSPNKYSEGGFNISEHREIYLKKIKFNNGEVEFILSDQIREDLQGSKSLIEIKVTNINQEIIKQFKLIQNYFLSDTSSSIGGITTSEFGLPASNFTKRLKLEKVEDIIGDDESLFYEFTYNSKNLPPKFSTSQDFWGKYNCEKNNSLLPLTILGNGQTIGDADRSVDEDCALASTLKSIKFPTGAETHYEFESNVISNWDSAHGFDQFEDTQINFNLMSNRPECVYSALRPNYVCEFSIPEGPVGSVARLTDINMTIECPEYDPTPPGSNQFGLCNHTYLGIFDENNQKVTDTNALPTGKTYSTRYNYAGQYPIHNTSFVHILKFGMYQSTVIQGETNLKIGGLRIKEIKTLDNGSLKQFKKFEYNNEDGKSTGYTNLPSFFIRGSLVPAVFSQDISGPTANQTVYYSQVLEKLINTEDHAISQNTVHKFYEKSNEAAGGENYNIVFPPVVGDYENKNAALDFKLLDNGFLKGNLIESEMKHNGNAIFTKKFHHDVEFHNSVRENFPAGLILITIPHNYPYLESPFHSALFYYNFTSYFRTTETNEVEYFSNSNKIENVRNHFFSSNNPFLLNKTEETNSLGETLKTVYEYPQDLPSKPQANALILANRISEPLVVKTYNGSTQLSEQETEYANISGKILPKFVYSKKGGGITSVDKKITYDEYDEKGNLLQYRLENGIPVSIIWGYNGQYPIAKIEGANYTQVSPFVNALQTASNNGSLSVTSFNGLRASLPDSMVTGYVYKPLIGVTAIVQPNGLSETYHYDSAGRLEYVKDHNGSILKKIDYNYKD